jgi:hypothetical protein
VVIAAVPRRVVVAAAPSRALNWYMQFLFSAIKHALQILLYERASGFATEAKRRRVVIA